MAIILKILNLEPLPDFVREMIKAGFEKPWAQTKEAKTQLVLAVENTCAIATKHVPKNGLETCTEIENIVQKILKPTSY